MRSAQGLLVALCLMAVSAGALADETAVKDFLNERDAWISSAVSPGNYDERYGNGGRDTTGRGAKRSENWGIFDWDFAAIQQWIDDQSIPADYYPVFTFTIRWTPDTAINFPNSIWVSTLNCAYDWAEGEGINGFTSFDHYWDTATSAWVQEGTWDPGEPAVTHMFAQTYYTLEPDGTPTIDLVNSVPWHALYGRNAGTDVVFDRETRELHTLENLYINSQMFDMEPEDANELVSVELDYAVTQNLLNDPTNFGLFLDETTHQNYSMYYKDNWRDSGTGVIDEAAALAGGAPQLRVHFSNAPLDYIWLGLSGNWSTTPNWFPALLPAADGTAVFQSGSGTGTWPDVVTVDTDVAIGDVRVAGTQDFEWQGPGVLTINGSWNHETNYAGAMDCYTTLAGPGGVHVKSGRLDLTPAGPNTYAGGTIIDNGARLHVHTAAALSTGPVHVEGVLYTNSDGCLSTPVAGGGDFAAIVIGTYGRLELNSTETANIEIESTGALAIMNSSYDDGFNYDWQGGGNVKMHQGAIVDGSVDNLPDAAHLAPGDGVFGLWLGDTDQAAVVGYDGQFDPGDPIYRGLATTARVSGAYPGFYLTSSVTETSGGTLGPMFLSAPGCNLIFDGAWVTADGANTIKLVGGGGFEFDAWSSSSYFNNPIEMLGTGRVLVYDNYALSGTELHMKGGVLDIDGPSGAALGGSAVYVYEGAAFQPRMNSWEMIYEIGTLVIKSGAALDPHAAPTANFWDHGFNQDRLAGHTYTMEKGSQLLLRIFANSVPMDTTASGELPGAGNANYVAYISASGHVTNHIGDNKLLLADDTRLTAHGQDGATNWSPGLAAGDDGYVGLVADATQALITNQSDQGNQAHFTISAKVDLTGSGTAAGTVGKLVIGDTGTFDAFGRRQEAFKAITQDGKVQLSNVNNVIGSVDIVGAAQLRIRDGAHLGGAETVNLLSDMAVLDAFYDPVTVATTIRGLGDVSVSNLLTLEPTATQAAGLEPGLSIAVMDVSGDLAFSAANGPYPTISLEVLGTGTTAVAGTDYDQVAITGQVGVLGTGTVYTPPEDGISELDLTLSLAIPSAKCKPGDTGTIVLLSAAAMGDGTTAETLHDVSLGHIIGRPGDCYWGAVPGESLVNYVDSDTDGVTDQIVLNGAGLKWLALNGDANLDDVVGIADLSALADNYGKTAGATWLHGDFNLDGVVGIADLSALADNYGSTQPKPGCLAPTTIPEPAALVLLGLGAVAVIRRRR